MNPPHLGSITFQTVSHSSLPTPFCNLLRCAAIVTSTNDTCSPVTNKSSPFHFPTSSNTLTTLPRSVFLSTACPPISSNGIPASTSHDRWKCSALRGLNCSTDIRTASRIIGGRNCVGRYVSRNALCNARELAGRRACVAGYCVSRYSTILRESEMVVPVVGSKMAGQVYSGCPACIPVGSAPIFFMVAAMSGPSTHSTL
ncbi:hypothetical protein FA95DRAFT_292964 [Auriscalpium vulgare]|uniref:Uncharacterized protein n=1 Tax=Auriscalpium vulgare TaxID=40419 RepID=A0ACB8RKY1_9AGAM|nr:hypothetical protein FA95DRAFT_292964 [Auriscalpium vulgare]